MLNRQHDLSNVFHIHTEFDKILSQLGASCIVSFSAILYLEKQMRHILLLEKQYLPSLYFTMVNKKSSEGQSDSSVKQFIELNRPN